MYIHIHIANALGLSLCDFNPYGGLFLFLTLSVAEIIFFRASLPQVFRMSSAPLPQCGESQQAYEFRTFMDRFMNDSWIHVCKRCRVFRASHAMQGISVSMQINDIHESIHEWFVNPRLQKMPLWALDLQRRFWWWISSAFTSAGLPWIIHQLLKPGHPRNGDEPRLET